MGTFGAGVGGGCVDGFGDVTRFGCGGLWWKVLGGSVGGVGIGVVEIAPCSLGGGASREKLLESSEHCWIGEWLVVMVVFDDDECGG